MRIDEAGRCCYPNRGIYKLALSLMIGTDTVERAGQFLAVRPWFIRRLLFLLAVVSRDRTQAQAGLRVHLKRLFTSAQADEEAGGTRVIEADMLVQQRMHRPLRSHDPVQAMAMLAPVRDTDDGGRF